MTYTRGHWGLDTAEHLPGMSQLCRLAVTAAPQEGGSGKQGELGTRLRERRSGESPVEAGRRANKVLFVISLPPPGVEAKNAAPQHSLQKGRVLCSCTGPFTWKKHYTKLNGRDAGKMQIQSVVHGTDQCPSRSSDKGASVLRRSRGGKPGEGCAEAPWALFAILP